METGEIMNMLSSPDGEVVFLATEILLGRDDIDINKPGLLTILHPEGATASRLARIFRDTNLAKIQCMMVLDKYDIQWKRHETSTYGLYKGSKKGTRKG